jgi:hypothetical protein
MILLAELNETWYEVWFTQGHSVMLINVPHPLAAILPTFEI